MSTVLILEGTWEEIAAHADELAGRRVRVTVLDSENAAVRQPSAFIETQEISAPFDLPRPGPGVTVTARPGGVRLPDPPADVPQGD